MADLDGDGIITMDEMLAYVQKEVPKEGRQEPMGFALGIGKGRLRLVGLSQTERESQLRRFSRLLVSALNGDENAMAPLGEAYLSGEGTPRDHNWAIHWFEAAAKAGNVDSMVKLGDVLWSSGKPNDHESAMKWYTLAAERESIPAMMQLADLCGKQGDTEEEERWYTRAAQRQDTAAMRELAQLKRNAERPAEAREWLEKAAELGDSVAMVYLAYGYLNGAFGPRSEESAFSWFERAAKAGNANAMRALAKPVLVDSRFVDNDEAARWLFKAATVADRSEDQLWGMHDLSVWYSHHAKIAEMIGTIRDPITGEALKSRQCHIRAVDWLERGVAADHSEAMKTLALMYRDGREVPLDVDKAIDLTKKAAELRDEQAKYWLSAVGWAGAILRDRSRAESST